MVNLPSLLDPCLIKLTGPFAGMTEPAKGPTGKHVTERRKGAHANRRNSYFF